jgi:hypothetical protein
MVEASADQVGAKAASNPYAVSAEFRRYVVTRVCLGLGDLVLAVGGRHVPFIFPQRGVIGSSWLGCRSQVPEPWHQAEAPEGRPIGTMRFGCRVGVDLSSSHV